MNRKCISSTNVRPHNTWPLEGSSKKDRKACPGHEKGDVYQPGDFHRLFLFFGNDIAYLEKDKPWIAMELSIAECAVTKGIIMDAKGSYDMRFFGK